MHVEFSGTPRAISRNTTAAFSFEAYVYGNANDSCSDCSFNCQVPFLVDFIHQSHHFSSLSHMHAAEVGIIPSCFNYLFLAVHMKQEFGNLFGDPKLTIFLRISEQFPAFCCHVSGYLGGSVLLAHHYLTAA